MNMNKKLALTILALLFSGIAIAQAQEDRWVWPDDHIKDALYFHLGIGPKIGAGLSMASNPSFFDFEVKSGFSYQFGAALSFHVGHHPSLPMSGIGRWALEIEALYEARSFSTSIATLTMSCLEIPILMQFHLTSSFLLEAGLTPVRMLNVEPEYLQDGQVVAHTGEIKGNDVMISAGAAYETAFGLSVGLRYNYGMSEWADNFHSKTSTMILSVRYLFSLTK